VRNKVFGFLLLFTLIHTAAFAQSQSEERDIARQVADSALANGEEQAQASSPSPLSRLGDEYTNSIELLRNRFHIDYNVDEVTMVFFREYGSAPVVLVRPDGSKIFQGRLDEEKVK
jgi:Tfp pilus assembly protein PilX